LRRRSKRASSELEAALRTRVRALEAELAQLEGASARERAAAAGRERALAHSESRFRSLAEHSPDYITRFDRDLRLLYANEAMRRHTGLAAEALEGRTAREYGSDAAAAAMWEAAAARAFETGEPQRFEATGRWKGQSRATDGIVVPERGADGEVVSLLAVGRDLTDRVQARQALRRSEERMAFHLDNLPMAVVEWDARLTLIRWSKQAERMFGYAAAEVLGRRVADVPLVHPDDAERVGATMARLACGLDGRTVVVTNRALTKSGEVLHATWHNSVQLDDEGRMASVLCIGEDITERTRALDELRAANAELAEADRRKGEFLAVLSHELRNPLAAVRNALHVMGRAGSGTAPAERARDVAERQTRQLARLVDDLLDVTRLASGKLRVTRQPLDMAALARHVVEDHRRLFEQAGVTFEARVEEAPIGISGDATRLAQLLGNLLQNAAKFTPSGGLVELEARRDPPTGGVVVEVRDSGVGIASEMLPRLFEPFAQADATLDRSRGGLGLGLALVKAIAELHGGSVRARSDGPGRGAALRVHLPAG
jgi:PAS domain S-box-containing protein